jgi:cytochrome c biogenesis factor
MARGAIPHPRRAGAEDGGTSRARRSHAAVAVAVFFLFLGLYLGRYTILVPLALGALLFLTGGSFLSSRLNPLSLGFYLQVKPSWTAIGVVFLTSVVLLASAYEYYAHGWGPLVPGAPWP